MLDDVDLRRAGIDCRDARGGLPRVGRISDHDPVAMAQQRQLLIDRAAPVGLLGGAAADG
jgi:hypothetical protein